MNFEFPSDDDSDRGQVGIGTLIVFIAMVLVAAIAAGVLINTAGFLQSSAQESGTGAAEQTTNRLELAGSVTGADKDSNDEIDLVTMNVKRESGAGNIDLASMTIQYVGPGGAHTLTYVGTEGDTTNQFDVSAVKDDDTSVKGSGDPVLNDDTDVAAITIDLDKNSGDPDNSDLSQLAAGQRATLTITTDSGGETEVRLQVPDTIQGTTVTLTP